MSWKTPSLWRRSTLKGTRCRKTRSTGERSCWRCPAFARSTPPSSAFEAPTYRSAAGFSVCCSRHACPTYKRRKRSIIHTEHTPASPSCAVTPYTNMYSNFELATAYLTYMCALTHAMVLLIRLDINCRKNAPTHQHCFVFFLYLHFAIWFVFFTILHAVDWTTMQWCSHYFSCTATSNVRKSLNVIKLARHLSLHIEEWRRFTVQSVVLKKDKYVNFKGKFHCKTESVYICQYCQSSDSNMYQGSEVSVDSHRKMLRCLKIQVSSWKLPFKY